MGQEGKRQNLDDFWAVESRVRRIHPEEKKRKTWGPWGKEGCSGGS